VTCNDGCLHAQVVQVGRVELHELSQDVADAVSEGGLEGLAVTHDHDGGGVRE
jgi:hypothetical protein